MPIYHTIDHLTADLTDMATGAKRHLAVAVRDSAEFGNKVGKAFAKVSAGDHGKHYHRAWTVERRELLSYEYGPDAARPQGGMSFERGSRNQPPHLDLARAADLTGPLLATAVRYALDQIFWP